MRDTESHDLLFKRVLNVIPVIDRENMTIVTEREKGIVKSIEVNTKLMKPFYCWNHFKSDVRDWLKKRHLKSDNFHVYKHCLRVKVPRN